MWLPQGGALKIENLQLTQYSNVLYSERPHTFMSTIIKHYSLYVNRRSVVVQTVLPCRNKL